MTETSAARACRHGRAKRPKAKIGLVFEAAHLAGLPLFASEPPALADHIARVEDKLALLPRSVRRPRAEAKDDF